MCVCIRVIIHSEDKMSPHSNKTPQRSVTAIRKVKTPKVSYFVWLPMLKVMAR